MTDADEYPTVKEILPPRSEYRFELEQGQRQAIRLVPGTGDAEIFGAGLYAKDAGGWYVFGDEVKACVCSWNGCEIELCECYDKCECDLGEVYKKLISSHHIPKWTHRRLDLAQLSAPPPTAAYLSSEPSPTFSSYTTLHLHQEKARLNARNHIRANPSLVYDLRQLSENDDPQSTTDLYRPEGQGPRILLLGPEASGKSSLTKFLCNYALRSPATTSTGQETTEQQEIKEGQVQGSEATGWWPVLVNLDPAVGSPPLPCTISAHPLSPLPQSTLTSATPLLPYGLTSPISGALPPTAFTASSSSSIAMWLGRESYRENDAHAKAIIHSLAHQVEKRMCRDLQARMSGMVIDSWATSSADSKTKYAMVKEVVKAFHIDTILVLGQEKVTIDLTRIFGASNAAKEFTPKPPQVLKLPKSGGVVEEDDAYKSRLRNAQVRTYFYGGSTAHAAFSNGSRKAGDDESGNALNKDGPEKIVKVPGDDEPLGGLGHLNPYSQTIPLDLLEIYRVGQGERLRWSMG